MRKTLFTDVEIIEGIGKQNKAVLLYIYKKTFRSVKQYIEMNNGTDKDAEDIFQDVFILLYNKIRNNELELRSSFQTYFFAIAKNYWLNHLTSARRKNTDIEDLDTFIMDDSDLALKLVDTSRRRMFIRYFEELGDECKRIISYTLKGLKVSEITKRMSFSTEQHTRNRQLKCKKSLIDRIMQDPNFKNLANGKVRDLNQLPS